MKKPTHFNSSKITVKPGCKRYVAAMLYGLIKSGYIINSDTGKPVTQKNIIHLLSEMGLSLNIRSLMNSEKQYLKRNNITADRFLKNITAELEAYFWSLKK